MQMRRIRIYLVVVTALAVSAFTAIPAGANSIPTTGSPLRVGLPCVGTPCTSTLPANEPFFVSHGFVNEAKEALVSPETRYELSVDGDPVPSTVDLELSGEASSKLNVSNFRFGMTGTHVFVGCWYFEGVFLYCAQNTVTFVG
jgi:hypothetical protein